MLFIEIYVHRCVVAVLLSVKGSVSSAVSHFFWSAEITLRYPKMSPAFRELPRVVGEDMGEELEDGGRLAGRLKHWNSVLPAHTEPLKAY